MASKILWDAGWNSRGGVLGSELDSLANGDRTDPGTEVDNSTNLDQYGKLELVLVFSAAPADLLFIAIYMVTAPNGTDYEDGDSSVAPAPTRLICQVPIRSGATTQRLTTPPFLLEPAKTKFLLSNLTDKSLNSSGSSVTLYTANDEAQ